MTTIESARGTRTDVPNPYKGSFWLRPLQDIDADLAALHADGPTFLPEPSYGGLLPEGPGAWLFAGYEDVMHISRHPELFSSAQGVGIGDAPPGPDGEQQFNSIIGMDDPRHSRQRRIVSLGFTPRMLARLNETVQAVAEDIVSDIIERGEVDFVTDVAARLPLKIVCDLMGIPEEHYQLAFDATNIILGATDPEFNPEGEDIFTATRRASKTLNEIMEEVAEAKKGGDGTDLTSVLVNATSEDDLLSYGELAGFFGLLVVAGNETTRNAISWGLEFLTNNPDQLAIWQNDFEGVAPTAVEEIVRYASPVIYMRRTATEDTDVNGTEVRRGDKLVMHYYGANRDATVFEDPYRFDVRRTPNHHHGFGGPGPHFCLGAHLARREITVMFRELFRRIPDIRVTGEPKVLQSSFIHGIKHMEASFTPGGAAA